MNYRPTIANINGVALAHNVKQFAERAGDAKLMAVVKADAYGHGSLMCGRIALANGASMLATATVEEAIELRVGGISAEILVLGAVLTQDAMEALIKEKVSFPIYSLEQVEEANRAAIAQNGTAKVHIKLETGFNRIGIPVEELDGLLTRIEECPEIAVEGLFTHFATADEFDDSFVHAQYARVEKADAIFARHGIHPMVHVCNTAGILRYPQYTRDMVRLGVGMYGYPPSELLKDEIDYWPVMSVVSAITRLREIAPGEVVGYGCTYIAEKPILLATVPVGYADGYPRRLSNHGQVLVGGKRCPIVGRVCMDQLMVDVSGADAKVGDQVVLMGRQGNDAIWAEEIAQWCDTISYEILTALSARIPREYVFDFQR